MAVVLLAAMAVGVVAVAAGRNGGDQGVRLASNCPDAGTVPTLNPDDQQLLDDTEDLACVAEPETTTTSISATTTTVDATVDASPPVSRLTASEDGLDVTVDVRPPELAAGRRPHAGDHGPGRRRRPH